MRNKMILFFCMLLVSLSVPFPTYAEADVISDVAEETTFTCKIKSFYSDGFIPQSGDTFYIEYTNTENIILSMLLDASECVNDWKEVEMASGTYSITKITYVGDNTDIIQSGYSITSDFSTEEGNCIQLGIGDTQASRVHTEYKDTVFVPGTLQEQNIANGLNEGAGESDMSSEESSSIEKEEQDHLTEDSDINSSQKDKKRAHYEKSTRKIFIQNIPVFVITIIIVILFLGHVMNQKKANR